MCVRHVHCSAFVSDIDDRDAGRVDLHPDRHDVPAAQPEYTLDAASFEEARDDNCRCTRKS
jgi:hypothetical protein